MTMDTREAAIARTGWGNPFHFWQPRNACFWVYVLGVGYGVWVLFGMINQGIRLYAPALTASAIIFAIYAVLFWWFTERIDRYSKQPLALVVAAFVWGGFAATWAIALSGNSALLDLYGKLFGESFQQAFGAGLTAPFFEELGKASGVLLLMFIAPRVVRTAYDGFIIGAFAGLGFEIIEDISYGLNSAADEFGSDQLSTSLHTVGLRLLTGFSSHILYSAIAGAGVVYIVGTVAQRRRLGLGIGLVLTAMLLHGLWDANVGIANGNGSLILLLIVLEILVSFAVVIAVFHLTVRPEREAMRAVMAPEAEAGVITQEELDALSGGWRQRRHYRRSAHGRAVRRARHHRLEAAHDLADQLAASGGLETPRVDFARSELERIRAS
ncbi:PrsW family intramembrane metalloprotease [Paractinoplanes atraurantiacus]|uniref:Membrane proteinase PrsW, cleaves anti-sigma factor RsiW, M82 family n=1 Tax=Paractinoplanes atraurantiacus TaxID=1036182 RepID=A0A285J0X9_9ACTN|nr:PrsW family intramembrane metalloprotease [Actinoplanes atraurantiacus]SNY53852.1 Membrane proteinase PrsW, cleaves anti-sigma factor RsiW, M82 family [Actinoplanes atraurantiacus]